MERPHDEALDPVGIHAGQGALGCATFGGYALTQKRHILRVLSSTGGNKTRAAKILGIDTKTLYNKLKAYNAAAQAARRREQAALAAAQSASHR